MIKVFTLNSDGKIELTKDELKDLLDQAYWDGYSANNRWTYSSPLTPYKWTTNGCTLTCGEAHTSVEAHNSSDLDHGSGI